MYVTSPHLPQFCREPETILESYVKHVSARGGTTRWTNVLDEAVSWPCPSLLPHPPSVQAHSGLGGLTTKSSRKPQNFLLPDSRSDPNLKELTAKSASTLSSEVCLPPDLWVPAPKSQDLTSPGPGQADQCAPATRCLPRRAAFPGAEPGQRSLCLLSPPHPPPRSLLRKARVLPAAFLASAAFLVSH